MQDPDKEVGEKFQNHKKYYGQCHENPELKQVFFTQRRKVDKWGRMMLLKPDRNYYKGQALLLHRYLVDDFL